MMQVNVLSYVAKALSKGFTYFKFLTFLFLYQMDQWLLRILPDSGRKNTHKTMLVRFVQQFLRFCIYLK